MAREILFPEVATVRLPGGTKAALKAAAPDKEVAETLRCAALEWLASRPKEVADA